MKKLFYSVVVLVNLTVSAQTSQSIRVKAGENILEKLEKEIYLYPAFIRGNILFRDGQKNEANFNYNLYNGEMQFIDANGDTLSLSNELTIKYINIAKDSFYFNEGYLQLIKGNDAVKIARKQRIRVVDKQKIGAYDQPSSAGSISSYSTMTNNLRSYNLDVRQDIILAKETTYFIGDKYNIFFRASKKNFLKNFSKKENELNEYFKNNPVDFNKPEDLIKIIDVIKGY